MNAPWRHGLLDSLKNLVRFTLWICFSINVFVAAVFSGLFSAHFAVHLWNWCQRTLFDSPW